MEEPSPETGHEFAEEEARTSDECVEPSPVEEDTPGTTPAGEIETKKRKWNMPSMTPSLKTQRKVPTRSFHTCHCIYVYSIRLKSHHRHFSAHTCFLLGPGCSS